MFPVYTMVILILSYKRGISLHVPLPMNVANARYQYHSLLGDNIFQFWFTLRVSTASFKRLGEKACVPNPRRSHAENWQLYGRSMLMTGCCTVHFKRDARVYERVQPRLLEVSRCKSALFRSPKGSLVLVVSDTKLSQICCSARDVITVHNMDISRDLQY